MEEEFAPVGSSEVSVNENLTSFLVQFFGIDEITDSFENKNLLVSQVFKDKINEVDKDCVITCFFALQDIRALVGYGEIVRNEALESETGQEPYEIGFNWNKLVLLPYSDITTDADGLIVSTIDEEEEVNWEFKSINDKQSGAIREAIDLSAWETSDTLRTRYEILTQPAEEPTQNADNLLAASGSGDHQGAEGQQGRKRERENSRDRSRSRSFHNTENQPQEAPRRSRIPFDVTKMSYDQYCAKHYSYAIEMYRAEKLAQYHSAQAARGMAMGAPLNPLGPMGQGLPPVHMVNQAMMYPTGSMAPGAGYGQPVNLQMGQGPSHLSQMPMMVGQPPPQQPLQQSVYGAPMGMNMNNMGMQPPPQAPVMAYGYAPQQQAVSVPQGQFQPQQQQQPPPQQSMQGYGAPF